MSSLEKLKKKITKLVSESAIINAENRTYIIGYYIDECTLIETDTLEINTIKTGMDIKSCQEFLNSFQSLIYVGDGYYINKENIKLDIGIDLEFNYEYGYLKLYAYPFKNDLLYKNLDITLPLEGIFPYLDIMFPDSYMNIYKHIYRMNKLYNKIPDDKKLLLEIGGNDEY